MQRSVFAITSALFFAGAVVNASPLSSAVKARAVAVVPGWDSLGCYTEASTTRALTGNSYFDDMLNVQKCAAVCSNFAFFGVEYGREVSTYCSPMHSD